MTHPEAADRPVGGPVSLVVHRRIDTAQDAAYAAWQERIGRAVATHPGFVRREVFPPNPPFQDDWIVVEHFQDVDHVRGWLQSDQRRRLLADVNDLDVGNDELHIVAEGDKPVQVASVMIATSVPAGREAEFVAWQREVSEVEARFDGFLGHRVERPVPGVQEDWLTVLTFDSQHSLDAWLESAERAELVRRGGDFGAGAKLTKSSYGFGFWDRQATEPEPVFHSNLLVLLMLYPIVFLWGFFVSAPLIDGRGVPVWLSLFIGNVVSTQLLGWLLVPWAFRLFRWWLRDLRRWQTQLLGYAILAVLYALSMALYAWLLALR